MKFIIVFFSIVNSNGSYECIKKSKIEYVDSIISASSIQPCYDTLIYNSGNLKTIYFTPEYVHTEKAAFDADVLSSKVSIENSGIPIIIESRFGLDSVKSKVYKDVNPKLIAGEKPRTLEEIEWLENIIKADLCVIVVQKINFDLNHNFVIIFNRSEEQKDTVRKIEEVYRQRFNTYYASFASDSNLKTFKEKVDYTNQLCDTEIIEKRDEYLQFTIDSTLNMYGGVVIHYGIKHRKAIEEYCKTNNINLILVTNKSFTVQDYFETSSVYESKDSLIHFYKKFIETINFLEQFGMIFDD